MDKTKISLRYYAEYIALKIFIFFIFLIPVKCTKPIAIVISKISYYFIPVRKKHIINSLKQAFPEKNDKEILKITKDVYRQFAITIMEMIFFNKLKKEQLKYAINIENIYLIEKAFKQGRGCILLSAHFGNWELLAKSFSQRHKMSVIVAGQENFLVDKMINDLRTTNGYNTIYKDKSVAKKVLYALKDNEFVAILGDQDANKQGVFVPFFGRAASTAKGPAVFALKAKCPVYTAFCVRLKDGSYKATVEEIVIPEDMSENEKAEYIMTEYNKALQSYVEKYPSLWFWFHRRWKTKKLPLCS
ncbi:lysophospholipid acyltransferase family protein [Candidatus Ruminimicrobium bovinum]|uniref:lysophospholipid acyltransferase family protein n=1 Tax=Candidatus Ruminimicrobium bovinum TaxID=3242779 RepID=UPI0039B91377